MKPIQRLKANQAICNIHADRLQQSLGALAPFMPFTLKKLTHFSVTELGLLDMLTTRFAKLQDTMGQKIFPNLLEALSENIENKSFIDILNRLEKLNLLPSTQYWQALREMRNHLTHEYPDDPDLMIKNLNASIDSIKDLLSYWQKLNQKINSLET